MYDWLAGASRRAAWPISVVLATIAPAPAFRALRLAEVPGRPGAMPSNLSLLSHFKRVVDLDPQVSHRAFKLGMAQEKLDRAKVFGPPVDQCRLRALHGMRAVRTWGKADVYHPAMHNSWKLGDTHLSTKPKARSSLPKIKHRKVSVP